MYYIDNTMLFYFFALEILKRKNTKYVSLQFPTAPVMEDEDDFPPPPPDALGLPPKKSHGSLEEIEVFKDVGHKRVPAIIYSRHTSFSTDPLFCLAFHEVASLTKC